ncbi:hypothetical protein BJY01DRAFT_240478 [Aspergillus pseudoustus]|uniref:Uncharacterized protein n=1 Tax=Aspergillus pseudoustus TaxID=1810923 RepID=A0ABR4ITJ5_9EURO
MRDSRCPTREDNLQVEYVTTRPFVTCLEQAESGALTNVTYQLPSADVNGIGVIVAFLLPAYISWLVFDTLFLRVRPKTENDWIAKFRRTSFLSVQQIVTGIGILAVALRTMSSMLVADFHSVIYLGWMSSTGYLATLTLLRGHLQEHPALRSLNLAAMATLLLMLCFAIFPTTNFAWADHILIQSACLNASSCVAFTTYVPILRQEASNTNLGGKEGHLSPQGVISYIILITGYFIRTSLFWLERALHNLAPRGVQEDRNNKNDRLINKVRYRLLLGLYLVLLALFDVSSSFAAFLGIVTVSFVWAIYPACVRRTLDTWDFDQILPVLSSLTPLYNVIEHCFWGGSPLKGILTGGIKSPDRESRRDSVHPSPETEPEPQCNLSARFICLDPSWRLAESDENNLPTIGTRRTEESALAALHRRIYSVTSFRALLTLLCILTVGKVSRWSAQPFTWYTKDWHLLPDIVAGVATFLVLFLVSLFVSFFSRSLSAECESII